jgi:ABC-2 type transport system permease protein
VVFSIALPILLLVLFNSLFSKAGDTVSLQAGLTISAHPYFTAGMLAYAVMLTGFTGVVITLTTQRESGELKRYRGTPVPAWTFIVSYVLRSLAVVAAMATLMLVIGHLAYDIALPVKVIGEVALYVALGTVSFCAVAIAVTSRLDSAESAAAVAPFTAVILSFFSGVFVPIDQIPHWLQSLAKIFPLYHLADGLQNAVGSGAGHLVGSDVVSLLIWGAAGVFVATRRFRWEPQVSRG